MYEPNKWLVCLGRYEYEEPPPPTWREYLHMRGHTMENEKDMARVCDENHLTPEELEYEIDGSDWADAWECSESSQARAYSLLKELNLGCSMDQEGKKEGRAEFIKGGLHPGSSECWVELRNDLTVSLLQAHIIERDLPIKITFDEA